VEFDIGTGGALVAGLLSFLSPCILPIVPFYLCFLAGVSMETLSGDTGADNGGRRRVVLASLAFALGVTTVFVALGASATLIGQFMRDWFGALRWIAAGIVFVMGLHFLGVFRIAFLFREARVEAPVPVGLSGAYVVGLAFAFGWTPCVGPILAAILFTAGAADSAGAGAGLLLAYAVGMTAPFVLAAAFSGPFLRWMRRFRRHLGLVEKIMGGFLILFALLIATNSINIISGWMLEIAPDIGTLR
jgi:cytochrome c-type biogenesis protein